MIPAFAACLLLVPALLPAQTAAPAEAEVSAVKGPLKLTLSVYKTKIKLEKTKKFAGMDIERMKRDFGGKIPDDWRIYPKYEIRKEASVNEPIWFKLSIQNVSRKSGPLPGDIFNPEFDFGKALEGNTKYKIGAYLSVIGPGVKPGIWTKPIPLAIPCSQEAPPPTTPDEIADAKARSEQIEEWKNAGLTVAQINDRLEPFAQEQEKTREKRKRERHDKMRIKPEETVSTPTWHYTRCYSKREHIHPPEGFAELFQYELDKPGTYRIRAIFDWRDTREKKDRKPHSDDDWSVRLQTPEIKIEVQP